MSNDYRASIEAGLAALQSRDMARAAALLREAAVVAPNAAFPWIALANAEQALGQNDAAEAALDQQLLLNHRDVGALLMRGLLREQAGDARAATTYYEAARNEAALDGKVPPTLAALHDHAGRYMGEAGRGFTAHLQAALGGDLSPAMTEAVELLTGKRELYLQQPTTFYYPGLPQQRFFDPEHFPWFAEMLALLPAMQAELAAVLEQAPTSIAPCIDRHRTTRSSISRTGRPSTSGKMACGLRKTPCAAPRPWPRWTMHRYRKCPGVRPTRIGHACSLARISCRIMGCSTPG